MNDANIITLQGIRTLGNQESYLIAKGSPLEGRARISYGAPQPRSVCYEGSYYVRPRIVHALREPTRVPFVCARGSGPDFITGQVIINLTSKCFCVGLTFEEILVKILSARLSFLHGILEFI